GGRQARPEDGRAQRHRAVLRPRLRQRAPVRHPRDAPHRRQREGLRQGDDHAEVTLARSAVAAALALAAFARPPRVAGLPGREPYWDPTRPLEERVADLTARMTPEEKLGQLVSEAPAIPRLGVPAYDWWNEALHGVARAGKATVFP